MSVGFTHSEQEIAKVHLFTHFDSLMITAGKHKRSPYLIVVVHAGEVSPAFVASDFNEALEKTGKKRQMCHGFSAPNSTRAPGVNRSNEQPEIVNYKIRLQTAVIQILYLAKTVEKEQQLS